jgi:Cupin-like domain
MNENDSLSLHHHSSDAVHRRPGVSSSSSTTTSTLQPPRPATRRLRTSHRTSRPDCVTKFFTSPSWMKLKRRIKTADLAILVVSALCLLLIGSYVSYRIIASVLQIEIHISWDNSHGAVAESAGSSNLMDKLHHRIKIIRVKKNHKQKEKEELDQGEEASTEAPGDDEYVMPLNKRYSASTTHMKVGDRSDAYADLRKRIDALLPWDSSRSQRFVKSLPLITTQRAWIQPMPMTTGSVVHHSDQVDQESSADDAREAVHHRHQEPAAVPYDIYHCPHDPPDGYPFAWNLLELLKHWPPDNITLPDDNRIYQGLCVFDYMVDFDKALRYRQAEVPFVVHNDPQVAATIERWNTPGYMQDLLGSSLHRTEYSENNHFMFHTPMNARKKRRMLLRQKKEGIIPQDYKEPTKILKMTYDQWLKHANVTSPSQIDPDRPHWYFRLIGCGLPDNDGTCDKAYDTSEWLFDELPFFQPVSHEHTPEGGIDKKRPNLYISDETQQAGIHCRFGMSGVIAENHFDGSKNAITVLAGTRRYILSHPNQCSTLALYPKGHPSARHSAVDWSQGTPDLETYPEFAASMSNEILLQAGQTLYLPTNWFHYIVSLELNMQCNTRSGVTHEYDSFIHKCGFPTA